MFGLREKRKKCERERKEKKDIIFYQIFLMYLVKSEKKGGNRV